jgi:uncharacterized membrane protein YedE/YeeE
MSPPRVTRRAALEALVGFAAGALFALGLALAGMNQPAKVIGFLDVSGDWDPSLALVMLGAIGVYFTAYRWARGRARPALARAFHLPARWSGALAHRDQFSKRTIDAKLVLGAALFGVGWGLGGYCPGPGLSSLGAGSAEAVVFVAAMTAGMRLLDALRARGAS